jgi:hypothetical protein
MYRIRLLAAAAALTAAGTGAAIAAATADAASASAPAAAAAGTTISFTEHGISDRSFNLGSGHGFAVGYVELVATRLMHGGRQIGHDGASYTVTRLGNGSADETVSAVEVFAHGQIDLSGLVTSTPSGPGTFQLAVTGGTGRYSDVRGYATVVPGTAPTVTIHLTP